MFQWLIEKLHLLVAVLRAKEAESAA